MNELNIVDFSGAAHSTPIMTCKKRHADEIEGCTPSKIRLINLEEYQEADSESSNTQQGGSGSEIGATRILKPIPENLPRPKSRPRSKSEGDKSTSLPSSKDSD
ncbi:uncharacterized protein LOC120354910 [Nilaparvata lugens]|uniref:uncharacterized protein LOC120354910 n=1 Tax=Nilaparvata lugens TaxID=108931 RepID=UPI00193D58F9|nr:uncharacterized protein LOC120354910 [Nilaparvata lugens]